MFFKSCIYLFFYSVVLSAWIQLKNKLCLFKKGYILHFFVIGYNMLYRLFLFRYVLLFLSQLWHRRRIKRAVNKTTNSCSTHHSLEMTSHLPFSARLHLLFFRGFSLHDCDEEWLNAWVRGCTHLVWLHVWSTCPRSCSAPVEKKHAQSRKQTSACMMPTSTYSHANPVQTS